MWLLHDMVKGFVVDVWETEDNQRHLKSQKQREKEVEHVAGRLDMAGVREAGREE